MMWWDILGVEPDADLKEIKKAYATLVKQVKPDDDQESFMRINKAFKQAKQWHERKNKEPEPVFIPPAVKISSEQVNIEQQFQYDYEQVGTNEEEPDSVENQEVPDVSVDTSDFPVMNEQAGTSDNTQTVQPTPSEDHTDDVEMEIVSDPFLQLMEQYNDLNRRLSPTAWRQFFGNLSLLEEEKTTQVLPDFLNQHHALSDEVLQILLETCKDLRDMWTPVFQAVKDHPPTFKYQIHQQIAESRAVRYYEIRMRLYEYFLGFDVEVDKEIVIECMDIAMKEPEVIHLFLLFAREHSVDQIAQTFDDHCEAIHEKAYTARNIRVLCALQWKQFKQAILQLKDLTREYPDRVQSMLWLHKTIVEANAHQGSSVDVPDVEGLRNKHVGIKYRYFSENKIYLLNQRGLVQQLERDRKISKVSWGVFTIVILLVTLRLVGFVLSILAGIFTGLAAWFSTSSFSWVISLVFYFILGQIVNRFIKRVRK